MRYLQNNNSAETYWINDNNNNMFEIYLIIKKNLTK